MAQEPQQIAIVLHRFGKYERGNIIRDAMIIDEISRSGQRAQIVLTELPAVPQFPTEKAGS